MQPADAALELLRSQVVRRRLRLLYEAFRYIFDRDATILISSISFSFLVSVFPFIVFLLTVASYLRLQELRDAIFQAFYYFFPISQTFIIQNLRIYTQNVSQLHLISLLLLAGSGAAFFFSLEAGFDSAYRARKYRHFLMSNVLGTVMTLIFGVFSFLSIVLLRAQMTVSQRAISIQIVRTVVDYLAQFMLALALTVVLFFTLFYMLPNRQRNARRALPEVVFASALWIVSNLVFKYLAPTFELRSIYGPFYVSVTLLLWAYLFGCILLGTARLSADGFFESEK